MFRPSLFKRTRKDSAPFQDYALTAKDELYEPTTTTGSYMFEVSFANDPTSPKSTTSKAAKLLGVPELDYSFSPRTSEFPFVQQNTRRVNVPPRSSSRGAQAALSGHDPNNALHVPTSAIERRRSMGSDNQTHRLRRASSQVSMDRERDDAASMKTTKATSRRHEPETMFRRSMVAPSLSEESYGIPSQYFPFLPSAPLQPLPPLPLDHSSHSSSRRQVMSTSSSSTSKQQKQLLPPIVPLDPNSPKLASRSNTISSQASHQTRMAQRKQTLDALEGRQPPPRVPGQARAADDDGLTGVRLTMAKLETPKQEKHSFKKRQFEKNDSFMDWDTSDEEQEAMPMSKFSTPDTPSSAEDDARSSMFTESSRFSDLLDTRAFPSPPM